MNSNSELLQLNQAGEVVEVSQQDAHELGAFEETALSDEDAMTAMEPHSDPEDDDKAQQVNPKDTVTV